MKLGATVAYARMTYQEKPKLDEYQRFIKWASKTGFKGYEIAAFTREHFYAEFGEPSRLTSVRKESEEMGLTCDAFEAGFCRYMIISPSGDEREKLRKDFAKVVEATTALGSDLIYAHSAPHTSWDIKWERLYDEFSPPLSVTVPDDFSWNDTWESYIEIIRELADMSADAGIRFALEIRPFEIISTSDSMLRLIEDVGSKNLGVVFDTAHFFVQKEILPIAIEKLGDRIFLVHLADNDGVTDYHWAPGKGKIHWESVTGALKKIQYDGFANIDVAGEYENIENEILSGKEHIRKLL